MSLRTDFKISTITKQDELDLAKKYEVKFASFEETFKPRKSVTHSKSRSPSRSPQKQTQQDPDSLEGLTRSQILAKLEMKEQDDEKEIDLNETSITGSNVRLAKSKNDLSRSLIANLDTEVDNLKVKRSVVMAERDKIRKEQIKRALEDDYEERELKSTYSSGQQTKAWNVTSTVQRKAFENLNEVLMNHKEKMEAIEKEYKGLAHDLVAKTTDHLERARLVQVERGNSAPGKDRVHKENLKHYSKVDPPPLLNSYMNNPFLMRKKKETPKEKKLAQLKTIKKKRDDLKTHKERFLEYLEDKKAKVERGKEEPSPDQLRREGKMEFRLKAGTVKKMSLSPQRAAKAESPKKYKLESSPSHHVLSPSNQSVKKLPARRFSERKSQRPSYGADRISGEDMFQLVGMFSQMKKGEKPTANKDDIWNYIMRNPQAFEAYNVDLMNLRPNLYEFPSEFQNAMSLEEFVAFLRDPRAENNDIVREVIQEIESLGGAEEILKETYTAKKRKDFVRSIVDEKTIMEIHKLHNKFENMCLLTEEQLDLFKQVFYRLVFSYDENKAVNRLEFIQKLREDSGVQDILNVAAVNVSEYDENLKVDKILRQIENEYKRAPIKKKKAKENITLTQFLKYFTNYELDRGVVEEEVEEVNYDDGDEVDVQQDRIQFFKEIFSSLPKDKNGLVETEGFVNYIYGTEFYKGVCGELAREKALLYELPRETIEETMARVEKEADLMISWDEFRQYFTRRGRPMRGGASIGDVDGSRYASRVLEAAKEGSEAYKTRLAHAFEEEESEDDIEPFISEKSKYMRYHREDKDVTLNKKKFKAALEAAEQERIEEEDYLKYKREEEERKQAEELKKKVYGSKFGALYKESADYKITEPQPFSFDHRDKNRVKSIRERKLEEMLLEKEQTELEPLNVHFRANAIPAHVTQPLYDQIMQAQEERRERVRMESQAMTKAMETPFSFYERDMNKEKVTEAPLNPEFDFQFKAKPLPKNVQVRDMWQQMQEKAKADKEERIAKLAEMNANKASLPPRMANSEKRRQEKLEEEEREKKAAAQAEKKVFRANPVPDFEALQREFQESLDAKRKSKKPTEPRGFAFQETRKGVTRHYLNADNQMKKAAKDQFKKDPFEAVEKLKKMKPKNQPPTTKKMLAMMDKLKADREEMEMRKIMKKMEEENRLSKYKKMRKRVQTCNAIVDMAREKEEQDRMIKEEIKRTMRENQRRYEEEMREIQARVEARPLLVEQEGERNLRQAQERAIREMMASEGRDPRLMDPLRHLSPEERAYYEQQAGYLRGPEEYGGVAEEEGEDEEEEHQGEQGEEGEEGEEEEGEYMTEEEYQQRLRYLQAHGYGQGLEYQQGQEEIEEEGEDEGAEEEEGEEYEEEEGDDKHHHHQYQHQHQHQHHHQQGEYMVEGEEEEEGEELEEQDYDDDYEN